MCGVALIKISFTLVKNVKQLSNSVKFNSNKQRAVVQRFHDNNQLGDH